MGFIFRRERYLAETTSACSCRLLCQGTKSPVLTTQLSTWKHKQNGQPALMHQRTLYALTKPPDLQINDRSSKRRRLASCTLFEDVCKLADGKWVGLSVRLALLLGGQLGAVLAGHLPLCLGSHLQFQFISLREKESASQMISNPQTLNPNPYLSTSHCAQVSCTTNAAMQCSNRDSILWAGMAFTAQSLFNAARHSHDWHGSELRCSWLTLPNAVGPNAVRVLKRHWHHW